MWSYLPIDVVPPLWADEVSPSDLLMPQLAVLDHIQAPIVSEYVLNLIDMKDLSATDCLVGSDGRGSSCLQIIGLGIRAT